MFYNKTLGVWTGLCRRSVNHVRFSRQINISPIYTPAHPECKLCIGVMLLNVGSWPLVPWRELVNGNWSRSLDLRKFCFFSFFFLSYGHLQAINETHLYWKWENTHYNSRSVFQDYLWIVQENHGMRNEPVQVSREDANKQTKDKGTDIQFWKRVWM